jgi:hypothetical protein
MRSMVERETQMVEGRSAGVPASDSGYSLSDPAPPGHLSLRERVSTKAHAGQSAGRSGLVKGGPAAHRSATRSALEQPGTPGDDLGMGFGTGLGR